MSEVDNFGLEDESSSDDDSQVMKDLRSQNKKQAKQLKELAQFKADAEAAAQTQRTEAATDIVKSLGYEALADDVLGWVEGEVTVESVVAALQAKGLAVNIEPGEQPIPQDVQEPQAPPIGQAAAVGQQVAAAAQGTDNRDLNTRINQAETREELDALMEEAELTRSHS